MPHTVKNVDDIYSHTVQFKCLNFPLPASHTDLLNSSWCIICFAAVLFLVVFYSPKQVLKALSAKTPVFDKHELLNPTSWHLVPCERNPDAGIHWGWHIPQTSNSKSPCAEQAVVQSSQTGDIKHNPASEKPSSLWDSGLWRKTAERFELNKAMGQAQIFSLKTKLKQTKPCSS